MASIPLHRRSRVRPLFVLLLTSVGLCAATAWGLDGTDAVAHWPLDDGDGAVARDVGPSGYDAQIIGDATWEQSTPGPALRLNGDGQYLNAPPDVPLFGGQEACTVMLWFRPEGPPRGGLLGRTAGNDYKGARLTLAYKPAAGDYFIQNLSDGENHDYATMFPIPRSGYWNHCALAWDGSEVSTYMNGALMAQRELSFTPSMGNTPFWIGRTGMWLGGPETFRGMLRDVYILSKALSQEELQDYLQDVGAGYGYSPLSPTVQVDPQAESGRAVVSLECALLEGLEPDTRFHVAAYHPDRDEPLAQTLTAPYWGPRGPEAVLDLQDVPPGKVLFRARTVDSTGRAVGTTTEAEVQWPGREGKFSSAEDLRILNNMTFELLNRATTSGREHVIRNPRAGWVYFGVPVAEEQSPQSALEVDGEPVPLDRVGDRLEAMRNLSEGSHSVRLMGAQGPQQLIVRAIGILCYSIYGMQGEVEAAAGINGAHDWEFLREHVLDHVNAVVANPRVFSQPEYREQLEWWHAKGRHWQEWFHEPNDNILQTLKSRAAMKHPLAKGGWVDEFGLRHRPQFGQWKEAMQALREDPQTSDRILYLYFMGLNSGMVGLVDAASATANRIGIEWYLRPHPTEAEMETAFKPHVQRAWRQWFERVEGDGDDCRVVALGMASQGTFSWDMYPSVDFRVFYDREFQFLATDPAFFGVRGVQGYWSTRAGEEMVRLQSQLMRHYFIEGRTDRYLTDPYILSHLQNPDFAEGLAHWDVKPAQPATDEDAGSVQARTAPLFGQLQGRAVTYYHAPAPKDLGDSVLWTRRSLAAPNRVEQTIRGLEPGRFYSLRWFTGDYQDLVRERSDGSPHAIHVEVQGAQIAEDPELSYDYTVPSIPGWSGSRIGNFSRDNSYYLTGHRRVFQAEGEKARLVLSDWATDEAPGGPEGQELIWNFVCVRPYLPAVAAPKPTPATARTRSTQD